MLAPWKCITPLWYALMHYPLTTGGNPRLGGLDEQRQIVFEQGAPWFPADFPASDAGLKWELEQRAKRKADWDRRPKGKRVTWESLDLGFGRKGEIGNGLACDFEHLFALPADKRANTQPIDQAIADAAETMDIDPPERSTRTETERATEPAVPSLGLIQHISKTAFPSLLGSGNSGTPPPNSIVTVSLSFVGRGVANTCARIYRLPTRKPMIAEAAEPTAEIEVLATDPASTDSGSLPSDLRDQWLWRLPKPNNKGQGANPRLAGAPRMPPGVDMEIRKRLLAESLDATELPFSRPADHPPCPSEDDLIGFVTTGAFSLSEGRGTAVGSISAEKAVEAVRDAGAREGKLCIVRNAGETVGWLARWQLA